MGHGVCRRLRRGAAAARRRPEIFALDACPHGRPAPLLDCCPVAPRSAHRPPPRRSPHKHQPPLLQCGPGRTGRPSRPRRHRRPRRPQPSHHPPRAFPLHLRSSRPVRGRLPEPRPPGADRISQSSPAAQTAAAPPRHRFIAARGHRSATAPHRPRGSPRAPTVHTARRTSARRTPHARTPHAARRTPHRRLWLPVRPVHLCYPPAPFASCHLPVPFTSAAGSCRPIRHSATKSVHP
jgi:hypothetical protein